MDTTPNLRLPYIAAAQAQKHVTHNEAIRALDALVQVAVVDRDLAAPPAAPADGRRWIVAASPTGAWAGHAGEIAAFQDGAWAFYPPLEGWVAWVADEDRLVAWDGTQWVAAGGSGTASVNPTPLVGVNATADTTNRLAVKSPASLFDNVGNGHQLKLNKAAAADTGSLMLQTGYAGRAELGLTGDDDFHLKVSANGTTWREALVVDRATGAVTTPQTTMAANALKGNNTASAAVPLDLTPAQAAAMLPAMTGDSGAGGSKGLVPAPAAGDAAAGKFLGAGGSWTAPAGTLPTGGTTGQVLAKSSNTNYAAAWQTPTPGLPTGGTAGQVLTKTSATDFAATWQTLTGGGATGRELLTAARTYFVRPDGSDANTGLANTAGGAFLTIQKAIDVAATLDLGIQSVTLQVAAGTYARVVLKKLTGAGTVAIRGDETTPANVVISTADAGQPAVGADGVQGYALSGMRLTTTGSAASAIYVSNQSAIKVKLCDFAASASTHMWADNLSKIELTGNYTISGSAAVHFQAGANSVIAPTNGLSLTVTLSGAPAFGAFFAHAFYGALVYAFGITFAGAAATGSRYYAQTNGVVFVNGSGASFFPGNAAGSTASGGQYV